MKPINDSNLQKEYKELLFSIKPLINKLKVSNDAALCFLWLSKIDEIEDKVMRNEYLKRLRDNVVNNQLNYPFSESPSDEPLKFEQLEASSKLSTNPTDHQVDEMLLEISSHEISPKNELEKYKERTKKYKLLISKYKKILHDTLTSNHLQRSIKDTSIHSSKQAPQKKVCRCEEDVFPNLKSKQSEKNEINERLLKENEFLRIQCEKLELKIMNSKSMTTNKVKYEEILRGKLEESFRNEVQAIVNEKNETIHGLELQLKNATLSDTRTDLLQTVDEKCGDLEKRFLVMHNNATDKHKNEVMEYRKKIEELQRLISKSRLSGTI